MDDARKQEKVVAVDVMEELRGNEVFAIMRGFYDEMEEAKRGRGDAEA